MAPIAEYMQTMTDKKRKEHTKKPDRQIDRQGYALVTNCLSQIDRQTGRPSD